MYLRRQTKQSFTWSTSPSHSRDVHRALIVHYAPILYIMHPYSALRTHTLHYAPILLTRGTPSASHTHQERNYAPQVMVTCNHNNNNSSNDRTERCSSRLYNLLTAPRTASDTYAQVARPQSYATHVQYV